MTYGSMFKPRVRSFEVENDDGEKQTFYFLRPRAAEMMAQRDEDAKRKTQPGSVETNRRVIKQWIVHEDATPIDDDEVQAILDMESSAFALFSAELSQVMNPKGSTAEGEQGKA